MSLGVKESAISLSIKHSQESTTKKVGLISKYHTTQKGLFFSLKKTKRKFISKN